MRLLIVGSLDGHIFLAGKIAMESGAKVSHVDDINAAMGALRAGQGADLVMVDVTLEVARLCKSLESERICTPVVACGIGAAPELAADSIRAGAKEYIPLPPDAELIAAVLAAVAEESTAVIYRDPAMSAVMNLAAKVARSDASVLITGESGTGKEVVARFIHSKSKRNTRNFISVNCAAIPENLLESELFGHEKGAFTGAVSRRVGKFEEADGGTLLLDEISEMHPRLQAKLLRAIQEREIDRVGSNHPIKVDFRLLATSNRALEEDVRKGNFRKDLYFRLNVINIALPALRDRPLDIEILAAFFLKKYAESNAVARPALSHAALEVLLSHPWRGNVRELENTMHRAVLLTQDDVIEPTNILLTGQSLAPEGDCPGAPAATDMANGFPLAADSGTFVRRTVAAMERDLIIDTLQHCFGNRTHAANILGISIRTLRNKLKLYSLAGAAIPLPGEGERQQAQ